MLIIKTATNVYHVFIYATDECYEAKYAWGEDLFNTIKRAQKDKYDVFTGLLEIEDEGRMVIARNHDERFIIRDIIDSAKL